jgi:hypothetical protein
MAINTQVPQEDWKEFFVTFSNGNRGRMLSLEIFDTESGDVGSRKQGKLMAVDYDPVGKGNDIVVTTGVDVIDYSHTIGAPVEVWKAQHENGEIGALEIIDQNNGKTIITLEPS